MSSYAAGSHHPRRGTITLLLDPTCPFTSAIAAIETWFGGGPAREQLQVAEHDTRALLTRAAAGSSARK
ncbi:hypothetical protein ABZ927_22060 [Streptomyces massasporeus]